MHKTPEPTQTPSNKPRAKDGPDRVSNEPGPIETSDWHAWMNRMPPGPASLHVTGTVCMPTPGYTVELQRAAPQGSNPRDLILDLKVTKNSGVSPQVETRVEVKYLESDAKVNFDSVLVRLPDDKKIQVKVENAD